MRFLGANYLGTVSGLMQKQGILTQSCNYSSTDRNRHSVIIKEHRGIFFNKETRGNEVQCRSQFSL